MASINDNSNLLNLSNVTSVAPVIPVASMASVASVASVANIMSEVNNPSDSNTLSFFYNNKIIIVILLIVIVVGCAGYYLYNKYFKNKKEVLNLDKEYYLKDRNGKLINVNDQLSSLLEPPKSSKLQSPEVTIVHPNEESVEDENVSGQNLTKEEMEELKKQIQMLGGNEINAQNEDDNVNENF